MYLFSRFCPPSLIAHTLRCNSDDLGGGAGGAGGGDEADAGAGDGAANEPKGEMVEMRKAFDKLAGEFAGWKKHANDELKGLRRKLAQRDAASNDGDEEIEPGTKPKAPRAQSNGSQDAIAAARYAVLESTLSEEQRAELAELQADGASLKIMTRTAELMKKTGDVTSPKSDEGETPAKLKPRGRAGTVASQHSSPYPKTQKEYLSIVKRAAGGDKDAARRKAELHADKNFDPNDLD